MDENIFDKIHEVDLKKTMEQSYIEYAMSVIAARALPDVRDGLKPVTAPYTVLWLIWLRNGQQDIRWWTDMAILALWMETVQPQCDTRKQD